MPTPVLTGGGGRGNLNYDRAVLGLIFSQQLAAGGIAALVYCCQGGLVG